MISGFVLQQKEKLVSELDPFSIFEAGSRVMRCLHVKFVMKLTLRSKKYARSSGTKWPGFIFKPESVEEDDLPHVPSQNSQHSESSMRKRRRSHLEADADVTDSGSCQTVSGLSDRRMTRRSTRLSAS